MLVEPALSQGRPTRVAVIRLGDSATAKLVARQIEQLIKPSNDSTDFAVIDSDQTQAAANGVGYNGSLNMTLEEARNLASAIGCDFFFTGIAQTLRRS
ncbi:MAG TPA: hypothetical protein VGW32_09310, partial [Pyrinomonadaceae bacterium]|nr:hypothetical protein [Pyrinomonadaceae bacterium]